MNMIMYISYVFAHPIPGLSDISDRLLLSDIVLCMYVEKVNIVDYIGIDPRIFRV